MSANVRHSSETNEYFTPRDIVEAARDTLGGIDLDPASCARANQAVRANNFYAARDNGFVRDWHGRVFLNPPGGSCDDVGRRVLKKSKDHPSCTESGACGLPPGHEHRGVQSAQKAWWRKLAREWQLGGHVSAAVFVSFSIELLQTSQVDCPDPMLLPHRFPICFPRSRIAYDGVVDGERVRVGSPPHSSMLVLLPDHEDPDGSLGCFIEAFEQFGEIVAP